ncbi:MAG: protein kinase [Rhodothermales bacterium]
MKDIDWDTLAELFQKALELSVVERETFLNDVCAGNKALRNELESLLENFEEAPDFFGSLGDIVPTLPAEEQPKDPLQEDPLQEDPLQFVGKQIKNYKVTELLGAGGMGIVYKAEDLELDRPVALKFLPPRLSHDKKARERFIVEAKAASRLDQANICTVYEVGRTDEGWIFIAMAYYQGRTLKELIAEKRISADRALDYATQICRGLCKAHANDIVHRDIKPANLMVTQDGVVKILDFGLAKIADQQLTQTGQTLGTASYMSPEQAKGGATDHRTDIWSLGALMYEMMAGERPFKGNNAQSTIYSILNEEPVAVNDIDTNISENIASIVSKCLQKAPAKRYQSADTLLIDLLSPLPAIQAEKPRFSPTHFIFGVLAAIFVLGFLVWMPQIKGTNNYPTSVIERRVALLPFSGLPNGNEETQALATGFMRLIEDLLSRLDTPEGSIWVVPIDKTSDLGVNSAAMASDLLGANLALEGDLRKLDNVIALSLKLVDTQEAKLLDTETQLLDAATIQNKIGKEFHTQLIEALTNLMGIELTDRTLLTIQNAVPDDPDAYSFYLQGIGYLERLDKEGYIDYAILQFKQSISADSLFAQSHAGLCEATWEKYRRSNEQNLANQAIDSCNKAAALSASEPVVLTHIASVLFRTGQVNLAESALRKATLLKPDHAEAYRWLGRIYERRSIPDSVVAFYSTAIALKPNAWIYYNELGIYQNINGAISAAATQFERVQRLTPDNHLASNALGITKQFLNEVEEADRLFRKAINQNGEALEPRRNLGRLLFRQKDYAAAVVELELAAQLGDFISQNYLGHALYWSGNVDRANQVWNELITRLNTRMAVEPTNFIVQMFLADALIATGQFAAGQQAIEDLLLISGDHIYVNYYLGRMYERLGEREKALGYLARTLEMHFDFYLIDHDPWLKNLHSDPRYVELSARYKPGN